MQSRSRNAQGGAYAPPQPDVEDRENHPPQLPSDAPPKEASSNKTGRKRKPTADEPASGPVKKQKSRIDGGNGEPAGNGSPAVNIEEPPKPRLTVSDLEFDWDRAQLRDPRLTPGRRARPRYGSFDIPGDLRAHLEATRETPKPKKPIGRLNAFQKDQLFSEESRINPLQSFHDINVCYDKGRDGSPTYDEAGFQLDYDKVSEWKKPKAYNKRRMVRGMEKAVNKAQSEEQQMFKLFFTAPLDDERGIGFTVKDYVKDHVSKDLGIPWHQVTSKQVQQWRDQGFQPVDFHTWWKEPTAEEKRRMLKLHSGSSLRKDL